MKNLKITRAIVINIIFGLGASIATSVHQIEEIAWMTEKPDFLTNHNLDWVCFNAVYAWQKANEFHFVPVQGTPYFKICGTSIANIFEIHNISGDRQVYVLHNPGNPQQQWLYSHMTANAIHRVTAPLVGVYYKNYPTAI
jgi:hypothetical protein